MSKIGRPGNTLESIRAALEVKESGCHEWTKHLDKYGYGECSYHQKTRQIHRLIYELVNGPIEEGKVIRHTCDNRKCGNIEHLIIGTHADNSADMVARNRSKASSGSFKKGQTAGENNITAKLTWKIVNEIRARKTESVKSLTEEYNVTSTTIRNILSFKTWNAPQ